MPRARVPEEQNAKQKLARRKRMEKPEYREEINAKQRLANRKRRNDPKYVEQQKLAQQERMKNPEYRAEKNRKQRIFRQKRMENPEDREKISTKRRRDKKEKAIQEAREGEELNQMIENELEELKKHS